MSVVELFSQPAWHRLSVTLVHFLWQGLVVAVIASGAVRVLRLRRGTPRYATYLVAFVIMAATPLLTFMTLRAPATPALLAPGPAPEIGSPMPIPHAGAAATSQQLHEDTLPVGSTYKPPLHASFGSVLQTLLPWMLVGWMSGVLILSVRLLLGFLGVRQWRRNLEPLPDDLRMRVGSLAERLGLRGSSRVFVSGRALEAVALGYLRPMVLLPATLMTQMQPEMLEAVIAHELAHIRRLDLWVNLAQRVVETLLFYHPAVWWLSSRLRAERELCCDELAVRATGERLTYVSALETAGRVRLALAQPALAVGLGQDRESTLGRIRHVLGLPPAPESRSWLAGVITVVVLVAVAMPTASLLAGSAGSKAKLGDLIRTFQDPNVNSRSGFGQSVATLGNNLLVGAPGNNTAYLFDGSTGELLRAFVAPTQAKALAFGWCVAALGRNALIADFGDQTDGQGSGRVYLFNGLTGELLRTFTNPQPDSYLAFGQAVAGMGDDHVIIEAACRGPQPGSASTGAAFLFDASTGKILQVFQKPKERELPFAAMMAAWVTGVDQQVLIGAPEDDTGAEQAGAVYAFDSNTGKLVRTFLNPTPSPLAFFGNSIAAVGDRVMIGASLATIDGKRAGAAYLFDRGTGRLLQSFMNPTPSEAGKYNSREAQGDYFGRSVAFVGNNVLIGATWDDTGAKQAGVAYLFDGTTGKVLHKFVNPNPVANAHFGVQVAALGNNIVIAGRDMEGGSRGAAYLFKGVD
jgi:beta-lactamase regulating signal transducer with metallopeptidase domain/outer membrane protein assembly factor BamB